MAPVAFMYIVSVTTQVLDMNGACYYNRKLLCLRTTYIIEVFSVE